MSTTTRALRVTLAMLMLATAAACAQACARGTGLDTPAETAKVDPEVEPLPPSPKRRMRDPRGVPIFDAGVAAASAAPVVAVPVVVEDASVATVASVASACGSKADPCPMQRFMHGAMETAHTSDTLTAAFTRVAGMSPDPAWAWVAIATRGADLANAGDIGGAKRQCAACHEAYRERYRAIHRMRKL